jgi:hypothetical protein
MELHKREYGKNGHRYNRRREKNGEGFVTGIPSLV